MQLHLLSGVEFFFFFHFTSTFVFTQWELTVLEWLYMSCENTKCHHFLLSNTLRETAAGVSQLNNLSGTRGSQSTLPVLTSQLFAPLTEHLSMSFSHYEWLKTSNWATREPLISPWVFSSCCKLPNVRRGQTVHPNTHLWHREKKGDSSEKESQEQEDEGSNAVCEQILHNSCRALEQPYIKNSWCSLRPWCCPWTFTHKLGTHSSPAPLPAPTRY